MGAESEEPRIVARERAHVAVDEPRVASDDRGTAHDRIHELGPGFDDDPPLDARTGVEGAVDARLQVGEVVLEVTARMPRCVMVNLPQVGLEATRVLDAVTELNDTDLGVLATVVTPGRVRVGDQVRPA